MTVVLLPNIEKLYVDFLHDQAEVVALVGANIRTAIPALRKGVPDGRFPLIRVTRYGGLPTLDRPLWLDAPTVQFDCYGGDKVYAWRIAETARQVIAARLVGVHEEGVVNGVQFGALADVPDPTFDPAKPRYIFTTVTTCRPNTAAGS